MTPDQIRRATACSPARAAAWAPILTVIKIAQAVVVWRSITVTCKSTDR